MIGAGEGYTSANPVYPILYAPAAPLAAEVMAGVLRGAYVVAHQHGTCLARTVRGIPQLSTSTPMTLEPSSYTEIAGCRWLAYVPAEATALIVVLGEAFSPTAETNNVERRVIVTDGTNTDTGADTPQAIHGAVEERRVVGDMPWPGNRWYRSRQQMICRVALANCSPAARLTVYVEGRQQAPTAPLGVTLIGATLFWSARG